MDMRVFWSVLAALMIFGVVVVGWRALERQRDIEDVQAALQSITDGGHQVVQESESQQQEARLQQQRLADFQRDQSLRQFAKRELASNQRCIGGVVVQVDGSTYTQIGSISNPVHCSGGVADHPLR